MKRHVFLTAVLTRFPKQHLSVAVLFCNTANATPTQYARAVAEIYLSAVGAVTTATTAEGAGRGGRGRGASGADAYKPEAADLAAYAGRYASDEAETEFTIALDGADLVLKQRPDTVRRMRPLEKDIFAVPVVGTVTFRRDAGGQVTALSVRQDRVWDLRFSRLP